MRDGTQGYLYYLKDSNNTKQLEYVGNVTFSSVEDPHSGYASGYATINNLSHYSTYIITEKRAEGPNVIYSQQLPPDTEDTDNTTTPSTRFSE